MTVPPKAELTNKKIKDYNFLSCMYNDSYFPSFLVDKCKVILLELCFQIESEMPPTLSDLYKLSHAATIKINQLENEFFENDSELETAARECLAENFAFIASSYGFEADIEELVATRTW